MLRLRSSAAEPQASSTESVSTSNRTTSFTLRSSSNEQEGVAFFRDMPLKVLEASPRRCSKPRFRFPGVGIVKAGLAGIRRQPNASVMKKPCVWVDTPKEDDEDNVRVTRAKSTTALRDRCHSRCTESRASSGDIDFLINDGVFNLPRNGLLQRSMFTLSRLPETETSYLESCGGSSQRLSARNEEPPLRLRSSASSMANMTPRIPTMQQNNEEASSIHLFTSTERSESIRERTKNLDSDYLIGLDRRSVSSVEISKRTYEDSFSTMESPMAPLERPKTRLESRLHVGGPRYKSAIGPKSGWSDISSSGRSLESLCDQPPSFRSDQILFHNSIDGHIKQRMDDGLLLTGRSEKNACIGKKTCQSAVKTRDDLRHVNHRGMEAESSLKAGPIPEGDEERKLEDSASEAFGQLDHCRSVKDSQRDDDCSVMEEPRNLAMWLEWLEERSDVTRKEILYRMGCQRAFMQEAQEKLKSHALAAEDFEDVFNPKMKDRLATVRRRYIKKARKSNKEKRQLQIDDDEITDINLDEADDHVDKPRSRGRLSLAL